MPPRRLEMCRTPSFNTHGRRSVDAAAASTLALEGVPRRSWIPLAATLLAASLLAAAAADSTRGAEPAKSDSGAKVEPGLWEQDYAEPAAPESTTGWGRHIQRTISMLADSRPEDRKQVRILFYGQSITAQKKWTDAVVADLTRRFPHADVVYENRAIGGFSSQFLVHTAEADVFPFCPDLMIFHVYGAHDDYQRLIHNVRSRSTAEIAIVTDHLGAKEFDGEKLVEADNWSKFMRGTFVPKVAQEYNAQLIDITTPWIQYLESHHLPSQALLTDGIHPNDHGCFLMSKLVARQLIHRPDQTADPQSEAMVTTHRVGDDIAFEDGKLSLTFKGTRVDLLAAPADAPAKLRVRVDGKDPSHFLSSYTHTRTSRCPGVAWPALLHVQWNTLPLIEDWTLTVQEVNEPNTDFTFTVEGSKTGPDGRGNSKERFVSDSGRVVIEPKMWMNLERDYEFKKEPLTPGFRVTWSIRPLFVDPYQPVPIEDPAAESIAVLIQGLRAGEHTLELEVIGDGQPAVQSLRTHNPPVDRKLKIVANPPR